jgi:hypothetical protein
VRVEHGPSLFISEPISQATNVDPRALHATLSGLLSALSELADPQWQRLPERIQGRLLDRPREYVIANSPWRCAEVLRVLRPPGIQDGLAVRLPKVTQATGRRPGRPMIPTRLPLT